jgi:hypothetical protein
MFGKERRIVTPGFGIMRKHHDPGSFPVDTVEWHKVFEHEPLFQSHKEGLTKKSAGGYNRQKMGLVRHKDMVIQIKDAFPERNIGFMFQLTVVKNKSPTPTGVLGPQGNSMLINYLSLSHSRYPGCRFYLGKSLFQILQDILPWTSRNPNTARSNAIDCRKWMRM